MSVDEVPSSSGIAAVAPDGDGDAEYWQTLFETTVHSIQEPVFVLDEDGVVAYSNDEHAAFLDTPRERIVGRHITDLVDLDSDQEVLAETVIRRNEAISEEEIRSGENAQGETYHCIASAFPLTTPDGDVVGAVEILTDVTDVVEQRRELAELQRRMSEEVQAALTTLHGSAEDVAESSRQISDLAEQQATEMAEVRDEVSSFSATTEEIASNVETVNAQSTETEERATESKEMAEEVLETADEATDCAEEATAQMHHLTDNLGEIEQLVEVITDIADQTNMLALNASIEAARTDGDGEGFAVVADEIKSLAEQSQAEVDEIEDIVGEIRRDADRTVESVELAADRIETVVGRVDSFVDNQADIVDATRQTSSGLAEISRATDEQASAAEEIASMVDESADHAAEIADEVDDIAAATEEQTDGIDDIEESVQRVTDHLGSL